MAIKRRSGRGQLLRDGHLVATVRYYITERDDPHGGVGTRTGTIESSVDPDPGLQSPRFELRLEDGDVVYCYLGPGSGEIYQIVNAGE